MIYGLLGRKNKR